MTHIPNHTPELNTHSGNIDHKIDQKGESLFTAFCVTSEAAQKSYDLADGIAAGRAWALFIGHFEKLPGVSAGGSV